MLVNITILLSKLPKKRLKQMNFYRRIKAITSTHQLTNTPGILPGNDYAIIYFVGLLNIQNVSFCAET